MTTSRAYSVLLSMSLVGLISTAGIALPYPILAPLFLSGESAGLTNIAGIPPKLLFAAVLAIYPLGLLIGSSFIGALSDLYGRKKTLLTSLAMSATSYLFSAYALAVEDYWLFLVSRLITGVFEGNVAIARAIAADLHPTIDKTRAFSWMYATNYAGWLIGPLAGGYLVLYSNELAFYVAAIAVALSAILVLLFVEETNDLALSAKELRFFKALSEHNSLRLIGDKDLRQVFYIYLLLTLGLNAFYEFYPLWMVEAFQFDSVQIGHSTAAVTLAMVLSSLLLVERIKMLFGDMPTICTSILFLCIVFVITPLVTVEFLLVYCALAGCLIGLYNTLLPVYLSDRFGHVGQGRLMGLLMSTFCLANILIAVLGGFISLLESHWSIVFGGFLMCAGLVLLFKFTRQYSVTQAEALAEPAPQVE